MRTLIAIALLNRYPLTETFHTAAGSRLRAQGAGPPAPVASNRSEEG